MLKHFRNRYLLVLDVILISLAVYLSFAIRLDSLNIQPYSVTGLVLAGLAVTIMPLVYALTGIYSWYWPYASLRDMLSLLVSTLLGVILVTLLMWGIDFLLSPPYESLPMSIPLIFMATSFSLVTAPRVMLRLLADSKHSHQLKRNATARVLVMGAGQAGSVVAQEWSRNINLDIVIVGFIDDDLNKQGMRIHGVPVLGDRHKIPDLVRKYQVTQVIIAMPTASGKTIREVVSICAQVGVQTKIMPGIYEILGGQATVKLLRDVRIEDLLRRDPVHIDESATAKLINGQRVMITGGGGSIGSELCRQVLRYKPEHLIILGHGEHSLFNIQNELQRRDPLTGKPLYSDNITTVVADIRLMQRLQSVIAQHHPQIVFHAAAHKHVPLMEHNPTEAITNNILGTRNLLSACSHVGVEHFVMISSDKAVNPTSVMGASKRIAELLVLQTARTSQRPYVAVRFGNVLGSRGSVVHIFNNQIASGGPVTVTDPNMERYFMTIPEAVQLVLQAAVLGQGGEVFTLDMGEPVKIVDLARDMIRLSGLEIGSDIDIKYVGIRPGEKMFEELFLQGEDYQFTSHPKIMIARHASDLVNGNLDEIIQRFEGAAERDDAVLARQLFQQAIPEYKPWIPATVSLETSA